VGELGDKDDLFAGEPRARRLAFYDRNRRELSQLRLRSVQSSMSLISKRVPLSVAMEDPTLGQSRVVAFRYGGMHRSAADASLVHRWVFGSSASCASASPCATASAASDVLSYAESQAASDVGMEIAAFASIPFSREDP
jgi:hypothetical protein